MHIAMPTKWLIVIAGQKPPKAPVTLDTYVDKDASTTPHVTRASDTLTGATSADVHDGLGHPGQGMSSKELRHDGQPGRKRQEKGVEQFGQGMAGESGGGNGSRKLDGASERRFVAPKSDCRQDLRDDRNL